LPAARPTDRRPRVVIVGGGFGGLACAKGLAGARVDVLLIDRRNYHQFTPLLYQVATALLSPPDIAYPFRASLRHQRNAQFRQARIVAVDLEQRLLRTASGERIRYDYLVLATGSENDYFGNRDLAEATLGMKTLEEAQRLRNHVLACLEHAAATDDQVERRRWLTFLVVGGGPSGVEYAGALIELLKLVLGREYPGLPRAEARIVLVEGAPRLLPPLPEKLGRYAQRVLKRRGVEVVTGALVATVKGDRVLLSNGVEIQARTVVWSAGVQPTDPIGADKQPGARARRLAVDERLRLRGHPEAFVIGDLASVVEDGRELPMLSPPAIQEGRFVARAITDAIQGTSRSDPVFCYRDRGTMAVIGRNSAVASIWGLRLTGIAGWVAWLGVHLYYLIAFRNRLVVLINWGWNYLRTDRPIRIITTSDSDPAVNQLAAITEETPAARGRWDPGSVSSSAAADLPQTEHQPASTRGCAARNRGDGRQRGAVDPSVGIGWKDSQDTTTLRR
jgi:NADH dehydrogenase